MTKVEKYKCDFCGREVENRYSEKDWVHIGNPFNISIAKGVYDSCWRTAYRDINKDLDFCSIGCLVSYLNKLIKDGK